MRLNLGVGSIVIIRNIRPATAQTQHQEVKRNGPPILELDAVVEHLDDLALDELARVSRGEDLVEGDESFGGAVEVALCCSDDTGTGEEMDVVGQLRDEDEVVLGGVELGACF